MKVETKITKCYLVECFIENTKTYYKSEYVFGSRQDAKALENKMKQDADKWLNKKRGAG